MKQFRNLLFLVLTVCIFASGCQSNYTTEVHSSNSSDSSIGTDTSGIQPEVALADGENNSTSQSALDEFAIAAGDAPPNYDTNVDFSVFNGVLTANGEPVPHNITVLDLSYSDFSDYQFLEYFTDLEELNLSNSSISDISVLSGLTNLKKLDLSGSAVLSLSAIKCLPQLWLLDVSCTKIDFDFNDWTCCNTLEALHISSTGTSNVTGIDSFSKLRELWCWDIPATDFSELGALKNMETLILSQTALDDIKALIGMTKLRTLDISTTNVQDFSLITEDNFPKLKTLSVSVPESQAADIESGYPSLNIQNFYDEE